MNRRKFLKGVAIIPFIPYIRLPKYYTYYFTYYEGGKWIKLKSKVIPSNIEKECRNKKNHIIKQYGAPFTYIYYTDESGNPALTLFHSLLFPDGRIWDSYLRGFRPERK